MGKNELYVLFSQYETFLHLNHMADKNAFYILHFKKMFFDTLESNNCYFYVYYYWFFYLTDSG